MDDVAHHLAVLSLSVIVMPTIFISCATDQCVINERPVSYTARPPPRDHYQSKEY